MRSEIGCTWAVLLAVCLNAPASGQDVKERGGAEIETQAREFYEGERWEELIGLLAPVEARLGAREVCYLARSYARTDQSAKGRSALKRGLKREPKCEELWQALIDMSLEEKRFGTALEQFKSGRRKLGATAGLCYRAAQAYYGMGQGLGRTRVVQAKGGEAGQFVKEGLLLEERGGDERFLCCPPESAMYMLRTALDGGIDKPAAHWMHARLWIEAGRADIALALLKNQEERWLGTNDPEGARVLAEAALGAGELQDYLRYARREAELTPDHRAELMHAAYATAAEQFNLRGDSAMSRELLRRAVKLRDDSETALKLADALWECGQRGEAAVWYRRILEREPGHAQRQRIGERLGAEP